MSEPILDVPDIAEPVVIGTGGFATVYRAIDLLADRPVAVKLMTLRPDDDALAFFERERRALARLSTHPHVVTLHRAGVTVGGHPYLVMELASGGSLVDWVEAGHPRPWPEVVDRVLPICDALEHAHAQGVLHRDIKPQNILISAHDQSLLSDFGVAKLVTASPDTRTRRNGLSIPYASPEQIQGGPLDGSTDVYSLGATLHALLAGRPAFADDDPSPAMLATANRVVRERPPPLDDTIPVGVRHAIAAAMAKNPANRPTIDDFRRALRGELTLAPPPDDDRAPDHTLDPAYSILGHPGPHDEQPTTPMPSTTAQPGPSSGVATKVDPTAPVHAERGTGRRRSAVLGLAIIAALVAAGLVVSGWAGLGGGDRTDPDPAANGQRGANGVAAGGELESAPADPSTTTEATVPDRDGDGVPDADDNCRSDSNPDQTDSDGDTAGDPCDPDDDNDGVIDGQDLCPLIADAAQDDVDGDGLGDACDDFPDRDGDGIVDTDDPCIEDPNAPDTDGDGIQDTCDTTPRGMVVTAASIEVTRVVILNQAYGDGETDLFGDLKVDDTKVELPQIPDLREIQPANWYSDRVEVAEGAPVVRFRVWIRDEDDCFLCRDGLVDLTPDPGDDALRLVVDTGTGNVDLADQNWNRLDPVGRLTGPDDGNLTGAIVQEGDDDTIHRGSVELRLTLIRQPAP